MTFEEVEAWYQGLKAEAEVPADERRSAMAELEVGQWPGDEEVAPKFRKSGRQDFEALVQSRRARKEQVLKAREAEAAQREADSLLGQAKRGMRSLLSPTPDTASPPDVSRPSQPSAIPPELQPAPASAAPAPSASEEPLQVPEVVVRPRPEPIRPPLPGPSSGINLNTLDPHERDFYEGRKAQGMPEEDLHEAIRQYRAIKQSDLAQLEPDEAVPDYLQPAKTDVRPAANPLPTPAAPIAESQLAPTESPFASGPSAPAGIQFTDRAGKPTRSTVPLELRPASPVPRTALEATQAVTQTLGKFATKEARALGRHSVRENARQAINSAVQGFAQMVGGVPKGLAIGTEALADLLPDSWQQYRGGKGVQFVHAFGQKIEDLAKQYFPTDPQRQEEFFATIFPQAFGSMAGFMTAGVAGRAAGLSPGASAATMGAAVEGASQFEDAGQMGADRKTQLKAYALGLVNGMTEGLPIENLFKNLDRLSGGTLSQRIKSAGLVGLQEGLQELQQQIGSNAIAQTLYDTDRKLFAGVGEAAGAGAGSGFLTALLSGMVGARLRGKQATPEEVAKATGLTQPQASPQTPAELQPVAEPMTSGRPDPLPQLVPKARREAQAAISQIPQELQIAQRPPVLRKQTQPIPAATSGPERITVQPQAKPSTTAVETPAPVERTPQSQPPAVQRPEPVQAQPSQPGSPPPLADLSPAQPIPATTLEAPRSEAAPSIIDLSGAGKAIASNMYEALWQKVQRGETKEAGQESVYLQSAKPVYEAGGIKNAEDMQAFAGAIQGIVSSDLKGKKRDEAIQQVIRQWTPGSASDVPPELQPSKADSRLRKATPEEEAAAPEIFKPRHALPPEQSHELLLRAEKAKADMEIAEATGMPAGGKIFNFDTRGQGGTPDVTAIQSSNPDWYKDLTTKDPDTGITPITADRPTKAHPKGRTARQKIEDAIARIIKDEGADRGAAVEKVKQALLNDRDFASTPWGQELQQAIEEGTIPQATEPASDVPPELQPQPEQPTAAQPQEVPDHETLFDEAQALMRKLPNNIGKAKQEGKLSKNQLKALDRLDEIEKLLPSTSPEWQRIYNERRAKSDAQHAENKKTFAAEQSKRLEESGYALGDQVEFFAPSMLGPFGGGQMYRGTIIQTPNGHIRVRDKSGKTYDFFKNPWRKAEQKPTQSEEDKNTLVIQGLGTGRREEIKVKPVKPAEPPKELQPAAKAEEQTPDVLTPAERPSLRALYDAGLEGKQSPIPVDQRTADENEAYDAGLQGKMFPPKFRGQTTDSGHREGPHGDPSVKIAEHVETLLEKQTAPGVLAFSSDELFKRADEDFGGTIAQGKYTAKDAYDAMELGVNRYILGKFREQIQNHPMDTLFRARQAYKTIMEQIMDRLPQQRALRTEEQLELQQFSTPPPLAFTMAYAAGIRQGDVVLEPSAGLGGLAVFAKNEGADVVLNELSPRRAALLKTLDIGPVYQENAEQLNNVLQDSVKPTVILMNPPFSSTAGRMQGQRKTANVFPHLEQALKRLQPGGRLVALIGKSKFGADPKVLEDWLTKTGQQYAYRARIGVSGTVYKKYGTTYDNQILVFDKIAPTGQPPVTATVESPFEALNLLGRVRDARQYRTEESGIPELASAESSRSEVAPPRELSPRGELAVPPATPVVGTERVESEVADAGRPGPSGETGQRSERPAQADRPSKRVELPRPRRGGAPASGPDRGDTEQRPGSEGRGVASPGRPEHGAGGRSEEPGRAGRVTLDTPTDQNETPPPDSESEQSVFETYRPKKAKIKGAKSHPGKLVESAAMAAVDLPDATYQPHLPASIIESGKVSDAQLESTVYAGQAHEQMLPDGSRKGFFDGDGTGVGKGREIAAIIYDNWLQGRKKAVWVSKTSRLYDSAVRDWKDVTGKADVLFSQGKHKLADAIARNEGVAYTTYELLGDGLELSSLGTVQAKAPKSGQAAKPTRFDQLVNWLGPDFDGVIVFDEAHEMRNNMTREGSRGKTKPSMKAIAGVELQKRFPKARIAYFSATGGIEASDFGYAERLGMWGKGTAFPNKLEFSAAIDEGGLAAMEMVAQDLKANGLYVSRSLSYDDVTYERLTHALDKEQLKNYDEIAKAWQVVLKNLNAILEETGAKKNAQAKSAARSAFFGAEQRFFNQILTAMQMPSVIERMEKDLDAGKAVVVQLVNTNEASQERQLEKMQQEGAPLEDLDLTPRDILLQYVDKSFPTQQFEEFQDENGNVRSRPVFDSQNRPVQNKEAVEAKEKLMHDLATLRVPESPLEFIINTFGPNTVAEVTGRSSRVVRIKDRDGSVKTVHQKRSQAIAQKDAEEFMADKRRILIFSDAGGTGQSFHADLTKKNQRPRVHYVVQPGWRADAAMQGLGRSHRTNQKSAPHYLLVSTDLNGHKRFISTIARRLAQLGALTKGQRQTSSQGLFSEADNLENKYATAAIKSFFQDLKAGTAGDLGWGDITEKLGLDNLLDKDGRLIEERIPKVPQFLNRILALTVNEQNRVFDEFFGRMQDMIEAAEAKGELDTGMQDYRADSVVKTDEQIIAEHPTTKAETKILSFKTEHRINYHDFDALAQRPKFDGWYLSENNGKVYAAYSGYQQTDKKGHVGEQLKLMEADASKVRFVPRSTLHNVYRKLEPKDARTRWEQALKTSPPTRTEEVHLLSGSMLYLWDRLPQGQPRVIRIREDNGKRHVGRVIPEHQLETIRERFNVKGEGKTFTPEQVVARVMEENAVATLANGWTIERRVLRGEPRLELRRGDGPDLYPFRPEFRDLGMQLEQVDFKPRYFIPSGSAQDILTDLTRSRPILKLTKRSDEAMGAASQIGLYGGEEEAPKRPKKGKVKGPEQVGLPMDIEFEAHQERKIGREVTPEEAPLFSEQAKTAEPEQSELASDIGFYGHHSVRSLPDRQLAKAVKEGTIVRRITRAEADAKRGQLVTDPLSNTTIEAVFRRQTSPDQTGQEGWYEILGKPATPVPYPPGRASRRGLRRGTPVSNAQEGLTEPNAVFEDADSYTVRPGDDAQKAKDLAQGALRDLDAVPPRDRTMGGDRRPPGRAGAGLRTVGLGISPELIRTGRIDLRGRPVATVHDLAQLAQVYRDPRFETLRIIYTKGGQIVAHEGVTSRLPSSTAAFITSPAQQETLKRLHGPIVANTLTRARHFELMRRRMQRLGADGYYLIHNHPSGNPTPSDQDIKLTRAFAKLVPGFKGHVVINSGRYATIDQESNGNLMSEIHGMPEVGADRLLSPSTPHPLLGQRVKGQADLVRMAKALQAPKGYVSLMFLDMDALRVRALQEIPSGLFYQPKAVGSYIKARQREFGSVHVVAVDLSESRPMSLHQSRAHADRLIRQGVLVDYIDRQGHASSLFNLADWQEALEQERENQPSLRAQEDTQRYGQADRRLLDLERQETQPKPTVSTKAQPPAQTPSTPPTGFSSSDPDIEARVRAAKRGVGQGQWKQQARESLQRVWHKLTREFEHLPDTGEFSPLRQKLLTMQKQKGISAERQYRTLEKIVGPLSKPDYDLFEWKVLLSDLQREADQGHPLPFGYTPEKVASDLARVNAQVAQTPAVAEAWTARQKAWEDLKEKYTAAMDAIGFEDAGKKLNKQDYFRHQVLAHAAVNTPKGTAGRVRTPTGRSFLKRRTGSTYDINANYVQAEFEVMAQMDYDTELAKVIKLVDDRYNILPSVKQAANRANMRALQAKLDAEGEGGPLNQAWNGIRQKIAMHMDMVKRALDYDKKAVISFEDLAEWAKDSEHPAHHAALGVLKWVGERKKFIKTTLGKDFKTWEDMVPEGYRAWQPREGNVFYLADSIPHQLAQQLQARMLNEVAITPDMVKAVLAMGGKREQFVIRNEVADTLDGLDRGESSVVAKAWESMQGYWKAGKLVGPHSVIRYNLRNLTGDADAAFVGNPKAFRWTWKAMKDLWPVFFRQADMTGEVKEWFERGGFASTLQVQELGDLNELKAFRALLEKEETAHLGRLPVKVWNHYWRSVRLATDYREALMRYANYLEYLAQIRRSGRPDNYGASIPETVDALTDPRDKAYKLSNELIGAYDRVSVAGQELRRHWIPFWSWKEVNFTRYKQLLKNAWKDGHTASTSARLAGTIARKTGAFLAPIPYGVSPARLLGFAFRATALWSMLAIWNHLFWPEEEDDLRGKIKESPHIILGRDDDGKVIYFHGIGALGDLAEWIGLNSMIAHTQDYLHGRMTLGELLKEAATSPLNVIAQGINPVLKLVPELVEGRKWFPDVTKRTPIRDRVQHTIDTLTPFGIEARYLSGEPMEPFLSMESLNRLFLYKDDPGWAAYSNWQDIEDRWRARFGKPSYSGFQRSPKGEALAKWRKALEVKDEEAAARFKAEYERLGGGPKDLMRALGNMAPLAGLKKSERDEMLAKLDLHERRILAKAEQFYQERVLSLLDDRDRSRLIRKKRRQGWLSGEDLPRELSPSATPAFAD